MYIQPSKLERYFARHEFSAPFLLCASDCETYTIEELYQLEEGAEQAFRSFRLGYTETQGCPLLREQISMLYTHTGPADIICCNGAEEGIFIFMNTLLKPGDHLIVQSPAYQSLYEVALSLECTVTPWYIQAPHDDTHDINFIESSINERTRAIVVNFPHNPTGYLPSRHQFQGIVDLAKHHNLYLFSDEVYRFLEYNPADRLPAACDLYEKAVSLGVMSKSFGLAGLRLGWVAMRDRELFQKFSAFKDFTTICNSGPGEFFTTIALKHRHALLNRNLRIIQNNLERLHQFFKRYHIYFQSYIPLAGPLLFPKLNLDTLPFANADEFCQDLVDKAGVLLLPGSTFNCQQPDLHVRFGFGRKNMPHALERLAGYLDTL